MTAKTRRMVDATGSANQKITPRTNCLRGKKGLEVFAGDFSCGLRRVWHQVDVHAD